MAFRIVLVVWIAALALAAWVGVHGRNQAEGPLPPSHSAYLHDVGEPITIARVVFMDDGGSLGVEFQDARGTVKTFCLVSTLLDASAGPDYLQFSVMSPSPKVRRERVSGVSERALLGLLERWRRQDSTAIETQRDFERLERGEINDKEYGRNDWRAVNVLHILRKLHARNASQEAESAPAS